MKPKQIFIGRTRRKCAFHAFFGRSQFFLFTKKSIGLLEYSGCLHSKWRLSFDGFMRLFDNVA
jgi:hypothetical protein